ncbi:LAMI_0G05138g1_1 [Lachancea mirantina]|uniref:LAMI_0G05138g1_1 n=1 Tax=Lachancea mirantina TaxID=1230905 RepID=A0A1G4K8T5_9SACH|nr:LAMI_0G05138g1_1 [Lachancea mirantina]
MTETNNGLELEGEEAVQESSPGSSFGNLENRAFQSLLLEKLSKIQEQNEMLTERMERLEKEQEDYYVSLCKKVTSAFKHVEKCSKDVFALKEVFREFTGVVTGERVSFLDHSAENVSAEDAAGFNESQLLAANFAAQRERHWENLWQQTLALRPGPIKAEESLQLPESRRDTGEDQLGDQNGEQNGSQNGNQNGNDPSSYKLNRAIRSVTDLAREYYEGLTGLPSVVSLERRFGASWRASASERTFFAKRMHIINRINDVRDNPTKYGLPEDITRRQAVKIIENIRLGNNNYCGHPTRMTLNQLYIYFAKKMDSLDDYRMTLGVLAKPRRDQLVRERLRQSQLPDDAEQGDEIT